MKISLSDAGKRFNRDWIFRNLSYEFYAGRSYAITGSNGSGKSTLLQVIAGAIQLSKGTIDYHVEGRPIEGDDAFRNISLAAPYLDLIEEMNLLEFLEFHGRFKPFIAQLSIGEMVARLGLQEAKNKQIRYFSSGMKQRVKLAQAFFCDTTCILLDEPTTNLDQQGIELYHSLVSEFCNNRLVIVSSNDEHEFSFVDEKIEMAQFK